MTAARCRRLGNIENMGNMGTEATLEKKILPTLLPEIELCEEHNQK